MIIIELPYTITISLFLRFENVQDPVPPIVSVCANRVCVCVLRDSQFVFCLPIDAEQHTRDSATTDGTAGVNTGATASGAYYAPGHGHTAAGYQYSFV